MKNLILTLTTIAFLFTVSSCAFRMNAKNVPEGLPDYKTTTNGDTILQDGTIRTALIKPIVVEKKEIIEEKIGRIFTVYQGNKPYNGVYYGKLNVLVSNIRTVYGTSFGSYGNGPMVARTTAQTAADYFLQKRGENAIYRMTGKNLVTLTSDNHLANRKAKAARIYSKLFFGSLITGFASIGSAIFLHEGAGSISVYAFVLSFPTAIISMPIAVSKQRRAIKIYNR